ncbi:hypothetical protein [Streptomyces sp. NPDC001435]|uniref:hypothetical protein n=1 Tax=unclassified Streptomyces TaxID=2593676 RepID=UPI0036C9FF68
MPAEDRVRAHQQPHPSQRVTRETVQQRGRQRPITRGEAHPVLAELAFQHGDLMAEGAYLDVLAVVTYRQQAQHGGRVRHGQVGQSQQHGQPSCRGAIGQGSTPQATGTAAHDTWYTSSHQPG